jgi:hypothetical protein
MNFVAGESWAMPVIHALREARHDLVAIAEVAKGLHCAHHTPGATKEIVVAAPNKRDSTGAFTSSFSCQ